jgi:pSer/pThr/pTyr-binding forkhead associated (FHA) protein
MPSDPPPPKGTSTRNDAARAAPIPDAHKSRAPEHLKTQLFTVKKGADAEVIQLDGDAQKRFKVSGARSLTFGRDERCDVGLTSFGVSRVHASIHFDGNAYVLEDQGSLNGTFVNGERVQRVPLKGGDVLRLGDHDFRFSDAPAPAASREATVVSAPPRAPLPAPAPFSPAFVEVTDPNIRPQRALPIRNVTTLLGGAALAVVLLVLLVVGAFALGRRSMTEGDGRAATGVVFPGALVPVVAHGSGTVTAIAARVGAALTPESVVVEASAALSPAERTRIEENIAVARQANETEAVRAFEAQLTDAQLRMAAGVAGELSRVVVSVGDALAPGQVVAEVFVSGAARVEVDIGAFAAGRVGPGRVARVEFDEDVVFAPVVAVKGDGATRRAVLLIGDVRPAWLTQRPWVDFR